MREIRYNQHIACTQHSYSCPEFCTSATAVNYSHWTASSRQRQSYIQTYVHTSVYATIDATAAATTAKVATKIMTRTIKNEAQKLYACHLLCIIRRRKQCSALIYFETTQIKQILFFCVWLTIGCECGLIFIYACSCLYEWPHIKSARLHCQNSKWNMTDMK